jgi:hypothetical protein
MTISPVRRVLRREHDGFFIFKGGGDGAAAGSGSGQLQKSFGFSNYIM